jgi:hypothetical protein
MRRIIKDEPEQQGLRTLEGAADIKAIAAAVHDTVSRATGYLARMERADRVRLARWANQQEDGRKPDKINGKEAEPWPKASDVRIRMADMFINDRVKVRKATSRRGTLQVSGSKSAHFGRAGKVDLYLEYQRSTKLRKEWRRQGALAGDWCDTYGYALTSITWKRETAVSWEPLTLQDLQQAAQIMAAAAAGQIPPEQAEGAESLALFGELVYNPEGRREAAAWLVQNYPDLDRGEAWKKLNELRSTGTTQLPVRYVRENRPQRRALKPFRDVFHPINVTEIQDSPWIAERWFGTPEQVDEKKISEGWSEEFAEAVKDTKGKSSLETLANRRSSRTDDALAADEAEETEGLCEVFYVYYKHSTAAGSLCIYRTVVSLHLGKLEDPESEDDYLHGPDAPLGYDHGMYPFNEHRAEDREAALTELRGIPELVMTQQAEVKNQRDARADMTDLAMRPPMIRPEKEIGLALAIRPKGEIGVRKGGMTTSWLTPPQIPQNSQELEALVKRDADEYFARNSMENPARGQLYTDDLIEDWCEEETECWQHVLALAQQFTDDVDYSKVVGRAEQPLKVSRDEIQGNFDLQLRFSSSALDNEALVKRLETMGKFILPLARGGELDLSAIVSRAFAQLFPEMADEGLRPPGQGAEAEIKDEKNNWSWIMAGEEPPMAENGQNFQLRAQWLRNKISEPAAMARLQQLPDSRELAMRRLEHLEHQAEQFGVNAETGRVGVPPKGGV